MCPDGILKQKSMISVSHTDVIKVTQLQEEYVAELQCDMTNAMEELVLCQKAMEGMSTQLNLEQDEMLNTGATYEHVGTRHAKEKKNGSVQKSN